MSKEQIAFWSSSGLSSRVSVLETKTTFNEENIVLLNEQVALLNAVVFPVVYGSFSSTQTQVVPADSTGLALTYNTTDIAVGCSLVTPTPTSAINIATAGIYRMLISLQCSRTGGGNGLLYAFPTINSVGVPNSTSTLYLSNNANSLLTAEFILSINDNQTVGVQCYSATAGQEVIAIAATANYPATPSIILTINRIG
jgi:hypothetical protein